MESKEPKMRKKSQVRLKNKHKTEIYSNKHIRQMEKLSKTNFILKTSK